MSKRYMDYQWSVFFATIIWTVAWIAAAFAGVRRVAGSFDGPAFLGTGVALVIAAVHCWITVRLVRLAFQPSSQTADREPQADRALWSRRITSWIAVLLIAGVAVVWNIGFITGLVLAAHAGYGWRVLIVIPWTLLGWFLLVMLFTGIGLLLPALQSRGNSRPSDATIPAGSSGR